ncbi:hypothetical protein AB0K00_27670 [Dactylosporangium sp. NPDC049525]|uniref:hypothetical protein n=1 Tax=Dactylosporangium sp. NPDC049525 TaxID=3154730 RepID=UPI003425385B
MAWWQAGCPVRPVEQEWIESSMDWLADTFDPLRIGGEVLLPTDEYFPGTYTGSRADVRAVFLRLCAHMDVDPARVDLVHDDAFTDDALSAHVPVRSAWSGAAGHHRVVGGRSVIGINDEQAKSPMALVATIAHELGHVLLLGEGRISADRKDHEPLTDLLTVYFGLGVFSANAAFAFGREVRGEYAYTTTSRLGYLTVPMFGYGLAYYAWLRGEADPGWARFLDTNPRTYCRRGLRYLRARGPSS